MMVKSPVAFFCVHISAAVRGLTVVVDSVVLLTTVVSVVLSVVLPVVLPVVLLVVLLVVLSVVVTGAAVVVSTSSSFKSQVRA